MNLVRLQPKGGGSDIEPYTVIVTLDKDFSGSTVTLTQGTEVMRKTCPSASPYEVTFKPMNDGTWTASSTTNDGAVVSDDVTLLAWGTYNITLESGFNFQEWLNRGRVTETYATLDNVLADEKTIRQLMTVHDSVDYMAIGLSNDNASAVKILDNDLCAKWINLRDYALDTLYSNATVKAVMDSVDKYGYGEWVLIDGTWQPKGLVPIMTSDSAPYGTAFNDGGASNSYKSFTGNNTEYCAISSPSGKGIGYEFVNPSQIEKATFWGSHNSFDGILQATNDTTWIDLSERIKFDGENNTQEIIVSKNKGYYKKYRIKCMSLNEGGVLALSNIQFYGRELKVSVPVMTSNIEPYGEAFASSFYEGTERYKPYNAFDDVVSVDDGWVIGSGDTVNNAYIGYDFGRDVLLRELRIKRLQNGGNTTVKVQGYDGNSWVDIPNANGLNFTHSNVLTTWTYFDINSDKPYRKYRIVITQSSTALDGGCFKLNLYGLDYSEREFESGSKMEYIFDHGVELKKINKHEDNGTATNTGDTLQIAINNKEPHVAFYTDKLDFSQYKLARVILGNNLYNSGYAGINLSEWESFPSNDYSGTRKNVTNVTTKYNGYLELTDSMNYHVAEVFITTNITVKADIDEWWLERK